MSAPDYTQRATVFVQKIGTDDAGYNAVGAPQARLTIAAALADLAANYPAASSSFFHIVAVGPGTFEEAGIVLPPWTFINGSCDGEGQPSTVVLLSADVELSAGWATNSTKRGGFADLTFRVNTGAPILDFTLPVPAAGNPSRTVQLFNIQHSLSDCVFEATSTADALKATIFTQNGTAADTFRQIGGTSTLAHLNTAASVSIVDKTGFAASGTWQSIEAGTGATLTASSVAAAGCSLRLTASAPRSVIFNQTAPGVLAVSADAVSLPVRASVSFTGTATAAANLTLLNDAAGEGYTPTTPANWSPVPTTVQAALDTLGSSGVAISKLQYTFTGKFQIPLVFNALVGLFVSPRTVAAGTVSQQITPGLSIQGITYTESGVIGVNLLTLSFDNLATSGGNIQFISMPLFQSFAAPVLVAVNAGITFQNLPALTSVSMPVCQYFNAIVTFTSCAALAAINLPELLYTYQISITTMAAVTSIDVSKLETVMNGGITIQSCGLLAALLFPALVNTFGALSFTTLASVASFNAPLLARADSSISFTTIAALASVSFPSLKYIAGAVSFATMAALETISFPVVITYGSTITANSALGNVANVTLGTVGTLKAITGASINISGQKLTAASVNGILALLVSLDGTGGTTLWGAGKTVNLSGGTSSAPTGQGLVDKATLQARGATVTTN